MAARVAAGACLNMAAEAAGPETMVADTLGPPIRVTRAGALVSHPLLRYCQLALPSAEPLMGRSGSAQMDYLAAKELFHSSYNAIPLYGWHRPDGWDLLDATRPVDLPVSGYAQGRMYFLDQHNGPLGQLVF